MVICGPTIIPTAHVPCTVSPVIPPYSSVICPVSPVPAVPYQPRYPTPAYIPSNQIIPVSNYGSNFPSPPSVYNNQNLSLLQTNIPITYSPAIPPPPQQQTAVIPYTANSVSSLVPFHPTKESNDNNTVVYNDIRRTVVATNHSDNGSIITCGPRLTETCVQEVDEFWTNTPGTVYPTMPTGTVLSSSTRICQISPNILTVPTWKQSYGMEQVWQFEFKTLFSQFAPHLWLLLPINQSPSGVWNSNVDSAKVRFCCDSCGHGWTSMKGRVAFWFFLNPSGEGVVCLKLYGQQCDRCKTGNYESAMWYPEEVIKVLINIYNRVGQVYYGFQQAPYHRTRRPGKPRTPHNSDLCQACKDGVCSERR